MYHEKMYLTPRITASDSPYLTSKNTGLGNVLFQIASCYGMAKDTGRIAVWNKLHEFGVKLRTNFGFNHADTIFRNCVATADVSFCQIKEDAIFDYNAGLIAYLKESPQPIEIFGHLECIQYFNAYRDEIVQLFSPDKDSLERIRASCPVLFDSSYTPVSIHFRGNEYLRVSYIRRPWDYYYYYRAIQHIKQIIKNPIFLVFSDDMENIDESLFEECGTYQKMTSQGDDYMDLWCLSLCKHSIVSHSTFSFWGAYLNSNPEKIVLCNRNEVKPYHAFFTTI
jgi:hypothetical protein